MNAMNAQCGWPPAGTEGVESVKNNRREQGMAMAGGVSRVKPRAVRAVIGPRIAAPAGKGVR